MITWVYSPSSFCCFAIIYLNNSFNPSQVKKLNSEIENLRKQKTELEEANKALTEELKQFKKDNNNIDGGKSVDVVEKDNKINHLESEIRDLNEKISFYEVQLRDAYKVRFLVYFIVF